MANADLTTLAVGNDNEGRRRARLLEATIDCAEYGRASSDVVQLIPVKAGERVMHTRVVVETAEGATLTVDLGDGTYTYQTGVNGNAEGGNDLALNTTTVGVTAGKTYADDANLALTFNNAASTAVIKVQALIADFA